jgi:hypothetical protein
LHAHRPARIIVYDVLDDLPDRLLPRTRLVVDRQVRPVDRQVRA